MKAGQILARIDDRDFKVSLEQARAQVEAAEANIANKQSALVAQQFAIDAARATVEADKADQAFAEQDDKRYSEHESLASLERRLDPAEFLRLNRSSIVRRDCIVGLKQAPFAALIALLSDGSEIRVGRTYARHIRPTTAERPQAG